MQWSCSSKAAATRPKTASYSYMSLVHLHGSGVSGARLSLQMLRHRVEGNIVVNGTAEIICGDKKLLITEDQYTNISIGKVYYLGALSAIPLEAIEAQSGDCPREVRIFRFEENYGRAEK